MTLKAQIPLNHRNIYADAPVVKAVVDLRALDDERLDDERDVDLTPEAKAILVKRIIGPAQRKRGAVSRFARALLGGEAIEARGLAGCLAVCLQRMHEPVPEVFGAGLDPVEAAMAPVFYFAYLDPQVAVVAGRCAWELVLALLPTEDLAGAGDPAALVGGTIRRFHDEYHRAALHPLSRALVREAEARDIPWSRVHPRVDFVRIGTGRYQRRVSQTLIEPESALSHILAWNKASVYGVLESAGLPVPRHAIVRSADDAMIAAEKLADSVVVKPVGANQGRGTSLFLNSKSEVRAAFNKAARLGGPVVVERYVRGSEHRLTVVDGRLIATAKRLPPAVVGDGLHTVAELIDLANRDPRRGGGGGAPRNRIIVDDELERFLSVQELTVASVPETGRFVQLRLTSSLSGGGAAVDVTDDVHPDNRRLAIRAAAVLGLRVVGLDLIMPDIAQSWRQVGGAICAVSCPADIRDHQLANPRRDVIGPIFDAMMPRDGRSQVPIAAVTGTDGKTTTVRMLARILEAAGHCVGTATSDGVTIAGELIATGDLASVPGHDIVLRDREVDVAVLETARGGLIKLGLAFETCEVSAITNIAHDHIGQDGITTLEQLAAIKAKVAHAARDGVVLNADSPSCRELADEFDAAKLVLTTTGPASGIEMHLKAGGTALILDQVNGEECIVLLGPEGAQAVVPTHDLPTSLAGRARHNIENAMTAAALAHKLGKPVTAIRQGLMSFRPSIEDSAGRLNFVEGFPFVVLADTAANPHALGKICATIEQLEHRGKRICLLTAPGDRADEHIRKCAATVSKHFDLFVCCDRERWRRGRNPGEISGLLRRGLMSAGVAKAAIQTIMNEGDAIRAAVALAEEGDFVAFLASDTRITLPALRDCAKRVGLRAP